MTRPADIFSLCRRLFGLAAPEKKYLTVSTLASIFGNLSHIGLMASGALLILSCAGLNATGPIFWGAAMFFFSINVGICRYVEGVYSHVAAYRLLAMLRVNFFTVLRRLATARLIDRQKGDIVSVAVADIETIEFFFAHTIGPLFTIILLPLVTLAIAASMDMLFALVLLPIYVIISVGLPLLAIKTGRRLGMNYRERVGQMKSFVVESVSSLKDIQIFGFGARRMELAEALTRGINRAAHALTLHRQLVTSAPVFFVYLARISVLAVASYLAFRGFKDFPGVIVLSFAVSASFSSTQTLTAVISNLLETFAAAERLFAIMDDEPEIKEAANPVELMNVRNVSFSDISFGYRKDWEPIIKRLNLNIRKGDKVGVMGESGAGKSTIVRLLLRFWEPD